MNIEYRLYPYPVLTYFSDDYVNSSFTSNLKVGRKGDKIIFHLTANTDDEKLLKLIEEEYAEFVFHIECPSTSYRTIIKSKLGFENISIHESLLNNKINICFFIIAKTQIDNYTNKNFNDDYKDVSFNLEKANILAIAKPFNIEIEKEKDNLVQMPSIFLILKKNSEDKSGMEIDMMNDRIGISLYKTEYEQYSILSKGIFQPLLHSSVIFPTLIYVFENLKNSDLETFEEYSWFKTIKKVLANMNIELNRETLEREFSYDLAQKIINFPVSRSFNAMMELEQSEEEIV
jgi:putative uncharacterized protein (fragment)